MKKLYVPGLALIVLLALASCVPNPSTSPYQPYQQTSPNGPGGMGGGMMGPQETPGPYQQPYPYGPGGMMGPGMIGPGMMGGQGGMTGQQGQYDPSARPITLDQAADSVRQYLNAYGGKLTLKEIMDFAWNFYAEVEEEDTGINAMELLIDKYTGQVYPEMGPNMMWNTKYGHMAGMMGNYYGSGSAGADMPVSAERAKELAKQFLDVNLPGLTVEHADTFYGYYTFHTLKDNQIEGMLSVNGYSGAVWYHNWHGPFISLEEFHEEGEEQG